MQVDTGMGRQERADLLCLMSREIVDDDVDLAAARLRVDDRLEARDEFVARVPRHGGAEHLARLGVERGIQRERPVAVVLEPLAHHVPLGRQGRPRAGSGAVSLTEAATMATMKTTKVLTSRERRGGGLFPAWLHPVGHLMLALVNARRIFWGLGPFTGMDDDGTKTPRRRTINNSNKRKS